VIDERTTAKFLRGLTLGAIIGAMIAGSAMWQRRRPHRRPPSESQPPAGVAH
jgi:uncharacterized iron-regulated membrane protein